MSFFVLWLLMILPNLQAWLIAVAFLTGVIGGLWSLGNLADHGKLSKTPKWFLVVCVITSLLSVVIPTKKEMAMIAAGGVAYNVVTSEPAKQLGSKSLELLNKKIDSMIEDDVKKEETKPSIKL